MLLEISLHSSDKVRRVQVENYNPDEINEQRNNPEIESIKLGNNLYSRIDLKNIEILEESIADNS